MNGYQNVTNAELEQLSDRLYSAALKLGDRIAEDGDARHPHPAYPAVKAAFHESAELVREVNAELRARTSARWNASA